MSSRRKAARVAPYVVVLGVAGLLYYSASGIDFQAPGGRIGPDFWPKMVLFLMIATCVYEIVKITLFSSEDSVRGVMQTLSDAPPTDFDAEPASPPDEERTFPLRLALGIGATVLYAAIVPVTGFFLTTFAYLTAFMTIGRFRRIGVVISVSLISTLLMFYFFSKVAYISLPIGTDPFSAVSLFLMNVLGIR
jgi:putative tricarboxylic transport membrane protein